MKEQIAAHLPETEEGYDVSRRRFFKMAGGLAGAGLLLSACHKDNNNNNNNGAAINLGSGDTGILNYAYALEQLEAAFYTQVIASATGSTIFSADELSLLTDIRDHEIAHREFFKTAIGSAAIPTLTADNLNFSTINFSDRNSVLTTAQAFEDLGVSAYNGAGKLITNPDYLTIAGKIVSVEARHAAFIRDLLSYGTFSDTADSNGLDQFKDPATVLATAGAYLKVSLNASNLPTM